jgi:hypothetical protein
MAMVPVVTALPQATDVEGRSDWPALYTDVSVYAANTQNSMGYSANSYLQPAKSTVLSRLSSDSIFHFNGHGLPGSFEVSPGTSITGTELNSHSYPNMKFALFQSCYSGQTSSQDGNLVASIVGHGSGTTCAFGYSQELLTIGGAIHYSQGFWDAAAQGNSPSSSHYAALNRLHSQGQCTYTDDTYCHYTSLVVSGICSSSLVSSKGATNSDGIHLPEKTVVSDEIINNAKEKIRDFTGIRDLQIKYANTEKVRGVEHYSFTSDIGQFTINSETGRVEFAQFNDDKAQRLTINQDQAYKIAESYVMQRNNDLTKTTGKKTLKNVFATQNQHSASDSDYTFVWREMLQSDDLQATTPYEITGLKSVTVIIGSNGQVRLYSEYVEPRDIQINLNPQLTEEQAWGIAKAYYEKQGVNLENSQKKSEGLWVWDDASNDQGWKSEGKQYLAWVFYVKETGDITKGGQIAIDSQDGHIINYGVII